MLSMPTCSQAAAKVRREVRYAPAARMPLTPTALGVFRFIARAAPWYGDALTPAGFQNTAGSPLIAASAVAVVCAGRSMSRCALAAAGSTNTASWHLVHRVQPMQTPALVAVTSQRLT